MAHTVSVDLGSTTQMLQGTGFNSLFVVLSPASLGEDIMGAGSATGSVSSYPYSVYFQNVEAGSYIVTSSMRDSSNQVVGNVVTTPVEVSATSPFAPIGTDHGGVQIKEDIQGHIYPLILHIAVDNKTSKQ